MRILGETTLIKNGINFKKGYEHFRARCNTTKKSHIGCSKSSRTRKTKSVINIVPNSKCKTLKIDSRCFK